MKRTLSVTLLPLFLLLFGAITAAGQTGASQISGLVKDVSQALIPGATITLLNPETGVSNKTVSDELGAYRFVGVSPGTYRITAELPGFQRKVLDRFELGLGIQARYDFTLEIGAVTTEVVVTTESATQVLTSDASVGVSLPAEDIRNYPIVTGNVLELLSVLPGYRESLLGGPYDTVGGLGLNSINTTIDGLSTNSTRRSAEDGVFGGRALLTVTTINPDLVGEIRLILSPVDAELGRGNSQVQIRTRSGTNRYTGSVVWNVQNSAFGASSWTRNSTPNPAPLPWVNRHQVTASYGGPIIKNKLFFFTLYDQQIVNQRSTINATVLTDTARQGIFRYWSGYTAGNANALPPATFPLNIPNATNGATNSTWPSVNWDGSPRRPDRDPNGSAYTGGLRCFSVFGNKKLDPATGNLLDFTDKDCTFGSVSGTAVVNGSSWDPRRATMDKTGLIAKIIRMMPHANDFAAGDGLNTANYRWLRGTKGSNSDFAPVGIVNSIADQGNRKQINFKIDANLTANHKVSGNWQFQMEDSTDNISTWGTGLNGGIRRRPQIITLTSTSTLTNSLVNEARFGMNRAMEQTSPAWNHPGNSEVQKAALDLLPKVTGPNGYVYTVLFTPDVYNGYLGNGAVTCTAGTCTSAATDYWNVSPLYNFADTVTWSRGRHSYRGGMQIRLPQTKGYRFGAFPLASTGLFGVAPTYTTDLTAFNPQLPALSQTMRNRWADLTYFLNGSIEGATHNYWIDGQKDILNKTWEDVSTSGRQTRSQKSLEWNVFFKDDYRITRRLTLNIGLRFDYYGSPYLTNGLTSAVADRGAGLYGVQRPTSGDLLSNWLRPGDLYLSGYGSDAALAAAGLQALVCSNTAAPQTGLPKPNCDPASGTRLEFIGPGSDKPNKTLVPNQGSFGPALGLAWQLPWFGEGKTSLCGGWQRTYGQAGVSSALNLGQDNTAAGSLNFATGTLANHANDANITAISGSGPGQLNRALNLEDLALIIPSAPTPLTPQARGFNLPIVGRTFSLTDYAPDFTNPYTDNFTVSVTRQITRGISLDTRYVATMGRRQRGTINLNLNNVFHNEELFNALERTRAGEDVTLFDQMFQGLNLNTNIPGYAAVGTTPAASGILQRGSAHLRRRFAVDLANGNFLNVVNGIIALSTTSGNIAGFQPAATLPAGVTQVQRVLRNGCDRMANGFGTVNLPGGPTAARCFPENYFIANPQLNTASMYENFGRSNSHSFQSTVTLRPRAGLSFSGTFQIDTIKSLAGSNFTDPLNRELDYVNSVSSSPMGFRGNGTFELPIGPNKLFLGDTSGWLARMIEKWQTSFIFNVTGGPPRNLAGGTVGLYANNLPDVVGPWDYPALNMDWRNTRAYGYGTPSPFVNFTDPQCAALPTRDSMGFNLQNSCTLEGLGAVATAGAPGAKTRGDGVIYVPLLQQARPGTVGNAQRNAMRGLARWSLNANASKTFRVSESKTVQFRIDARNVMNHPYVNDADGGLFNITSENFGTVTTKTGQPREFTAQLRLSF